MREEVKMSKIGIAELATVLMEKHGLKRTEAELFIRQFVVVVNESLTNDKIAKIKGLGTFKVTAVSPRKSVDVNTGEAIIIDGRDKITFTADTAMRDLVNAPFAQFETVVINDGVDFSAIDEKYINGQNGDVEESECEIQTISEDTAQTAETEPKPVTVSEPEPITKQEPETSSETETMYATEPGQEPEPIMAQEPEPASNVSQESESEPAPEVLNSEEQGVPKWQADRLVAENQKLEAANDFLYEQISSFKTRTTILATCLVIVVVGAIAGFFYLNSQLEARKNRIDYLEAQIVSKMDKMIRKQEPAVDSVAVKAKADSMKAVQERANQILQRQIEDKAKEDQKKAEEQKMAAEEDKKASEEKKPVETKKSDSQAAYNKDARVRTGAYLITGVAKTVTVKPGQTLSSISKAHLGPGMECYIEAVNDGKTTFNAGDKINIPELRLKKKK